MRTPGQILSVLEAFPARRLRGRRRRGSVLRSMVIVVERKLKKARRKVLLMVLIKMRDRKVQRG